MTGPLTAEEEDLVRTHRDSLQHDRRLLALLVVAWAQLSPPQRAALYRTADLFASKAAWRPTVPAEQGEA